MKQLIKCAAVAVAMLISALSAFASEPVQQHNSSAVWFENWGALSNATLIVAAPDGKITSIFAETGTPVFQLDGAEVPDGIYGYELTAATDEQVKIVNQLDNGRGENASPTMAKPMSLNGSFTVARGVIITEEEITEDAQ